MSGLSRWVVCRTAGLVGVVCAVALVVAPAAWASGDTINAAANVQFNGVVDQSPSCSGATSAFINWGDGSGVSPARILSSGAIVGTHTYATTGTFPGKIALNGGACGGTSDTFTANVFPTPQFTECPQVGLNSGCQFLIDVTSGGTTVLADSTQGPYEGAEDALIGVKNDSSAPLSSIPISTPGSPVFGMEQDGICDVLTFGPIPAGCQQIGAAPGTPCDPTAGPCAFPAVPGQTNANPDPYPGSSQDGYEGPQNYYTNVSTDQTSGTVNFSPAIPPGGSTYFSLEEPPSANAINVGATPTGVGLSAPPTVTATSASFVAIVNPNGALTTAQFQFNADPRYGKLASVTQSTPTQTVGGDFANHVVSATVTGLAPNTVYDVRVVATNKNGQTVGANVPFKTKAAPTPGSPSLGHTFNISRVSGIVLVRVNGIFQPLNQLRQFRMGALIDALGGTLRLITAAGGHPASDAAAGKKHKTQSGTFGGAIFKVTQAHNGLATLSIVENAFKGAPSFAKCGRHKAGDASAAALSSATLQLLRASARGRYSTRGRYAAATVRGTKWTIADKCNGTLTHDITDSVAVTDFVRHKTIILHAGQSYLAKKP